MAYHAAHFGIFVSISQKNTCNGGSAIKEIIVLLSFP